ncbi:MAG: hypothetical protein IJ930_01220 [Lachnospiraceae bacterium]|nr:hypothetical protein [Lachnospiraceae bacterium]
MSKKTYIVLAVILLEICVLTAAAVYYLRPRPDVSFETSDLILSRLGYENEPSGYVDNSFDGDSRRLETPVFTLDSGIYECTFEFETGNMPGTGVTGAEAYAAAADGLPFVRSGRARLLDYRDQVNFRVYVGKNGTGLKVVGAIDDHWDTWLLVRHISLTYLPGKSAAGRVLSFFLLFFVIDLAAFAAWKIKKDHAWLRERRFCLLGIPVIVLIASLPLFTGYLTQGIDLDFHLARIRGIAAGLEAGYFPVKIYPEILNGYGYASGIFYGDIFFYIPAILYSAGFTVAGAYRIFVILMNLLTAAVSYFAFCRISGDRAAGILGSAFYTLSLSRITGIYTWSSAGQWTAMAFLPLVILGFREIYVNDEEKGPGKGYLWLALGMTGIILTHILTCIMTVLFLVIAALILFRRTFTRPVILGILKGAALCAGLCCWFIVPFLHSFLAHPLRKITNHGPIWEHTVFLNQMFSNAFSVTGDGVRFSEYASMRMEAPLSLGIVSGLILLVTGMIVILFPKNRQGSELRLCILLTLIAIFMASDLFPYARLSALPLFSAVFGSLQFASRFLTIAGALIPVLMLLDHNLLEARYGRKTAMAATAFLCLLCVMQSVNYMNWYSNEAFESYNEYDLDEVDLMNVGSGEYIIAGAETFTDAGLRAGSGLAGANIISRSGLKVQSRVTGGPEESFVDYPLMAYTGYRAFSDADGSRLSVSSSKDARVRVQIPADYDGTITVSWHEPVLWRIAELVSLLTAAGFLQPVRRKLKEVLGKG